MCKLDKKSGDTRIDPCMKNLIKNLNNLLDSQFKTVACCCGHGKYPMSIVIVAKKLNIPLEVVSGKNIPRKKKFYKKDKQGYYYIPECVNPRQEVMK